ncbi:MAG: hypothetical protein ACP5I4_09255 [Oceanipulchritudo sp.]
MIGGPGAQDWAILPSTAWPDRKHKQSNPMKTRTTLHILTSLALVPMAQATITLTYNDTSGYDVSTVKTMTAAETTNRLFMRRETDPTDGFREALQSFTVDATIQISAVNILIDRAVQGQSIDISLIEWANATTPDSPGGTTISASQWDARNVLASESITFGSEASPFGSIGGPYTDALSTMTWNLGTTITLDPLDAVGNNNYAIVIQPTDDSNSESVLNWRWDSGDQYPTIDNPVNSRLGYYKNQNTSGNFSSTNFGSGVEADFAIGLVAVPEPAKAALLLGLATLGGALLRRRLRD